MATEKVYKRILLKLSGEALTGDQPFGIDPKVLDQMALEIGQLVGIGVQVGLVVGGGNLFRTTNFILANPQLLRLYWSTVFSRTCTCGKNCYHIGLLLGVY